MTTPYVDPQSVHNPSTGTSPPASWGDTVRDDLEFLIAPPGCKATRATLQSVPTDTATRLALNSPDEWDTDAFHNPAATNTRFTIPSGLGGKYRLSAEGYWASNPTGYRNIYWTVNGVTNAGVLQVPAVNGAETWLTTSTVVALNVGDYVEVTLAQGSGVALNFGGASASIAWVSR